jgi:peptide/nickel transport system ATP-binding protein
MVTEGNAMSDRSGPLLCEIDTLRVGFPGHDGRVTDAVKALSLTLARGERLGIVGESGSGKSITARALLGLLPAGARLDAKRLAFDGRDLLAMSARERRRLRGRDMGMIPQDPKYSLNPVMTVGAQLREAFLQFDPTLTRGALADMTLSSLETVRIRDPHRVALAYPHELSGGMGQRVMIAMMVSCGPKLLVADEPTSALDVSVSMQVLTVLDNMIAQHDTGLIFISHDLPLVMSFCDRVVVMYAGRAVETCAASALRDARHPYTRGLLMVNPDLMAPCDELPTLARDPAWVTDAAQ